MQYKPIFSIRYLQAGQVRANIQARQPLLLPKNKNNWILHPLYQFLFEG
jgi:hypothetical protein